MNTRVNKSQEAVDLIASSIIRNIRSESNSLDFFPLMITNYSNGARCFLRFLNDKKQIKLTCPERILPIDVSSIRDKVCDEIGVSKDMIEIVYE